MVTVQEAAEERIDKATSLVLHSKGVRDLSGLEQCVNLKSLDVSFNNISSTGPVDCISLKELKLCANVISSVTGLQGLSNLVSLDLSSNRLEDVSGLQYLRSLRSLDLSYNGLADFSSLGRTTNLESLKATANRLTSLRGLEPCASLLFLDVSANRLSTLSSSLVRCNRLTELVASENELNSVGGFKICGGSLEILDLSRNKITNLTGLPPDMPMLSEMLMAGNCLGYEAVKIIVAAAPNLEILDLGENKLFTSIGVDDPPEDDSFSNDPSLMRVPSLAESSNPSSSSSSVPRPRRISGTGAAAPSSVTRPPPTDFLALRKIPLGHGRTIALAPNGAFVRQKSVPSGPRSLGDEKKGGDKKKGGISRTSSSCGCDSERKQSNSGRSRDGPAGGGNSNDLDQDAKSNNNSAVTNNAKLATSNSTPLTAQSSTASTPRSSRKPSVLATPMERLEEMSKMLQSLQGLTCLAISESVTIPENFAEKVLTIIPQLQTCDQVERVVGVMPPPPPPDLKAAAANKAAQKAARREQRHKAREERKCQREEEQRRRREERRERKRREREEKRRESEEKKKERDEVNVKREGRVAMDGLENGPASFDKNASFSSDVKNGNDDTDQGDATAANSLLLDKTSKRNSHSDNNDDDTTAARNDGDNYDSSDDSDEESFILDDDDSFSGSSGSSSDEEKDPTRFDPTLEEMEVFKAKLNIKTDVPILGRVANVAPPPPPPPPPRPSSGRPTSARPLSASSGASLRLSTSGLGVGVSAAAAAATAATASKSNSNGGLRTITPPLRDSLMHVRPGSARLAARVLSAEQFGGAMNDFKERMKGYVSALQGSLAQLRAGMALSADDAAARVVKSDKGLWQDVPVMPLAPELRMTRPLASTLEDETAKRMRKAAETKKAMPMGRAVGGQNEGKGEQTAPGEKRDQRGKGFIASSKEVGGRESKGNERETGQKEGGVKEGVMEEGVKEEGPVTMLSSEEEAAAEKQRQRKRMISLYGSGMADGAAALEKFMSLFPEKEDDSKNAEFKQPYKLPEFSDSDDDGGDGDAGKKYEDDHSRFSRRDPTNATPGANALLARLRPESAVRKRTVADELVVPVSTAKGREWRETALRFEGVEDVSSTATLDDRVISNGSRNDENTRQKSSMADHSAENYDASSISSYIGNSLYSRSKKEAFSVGFGGNRDLDDDDRNVVMRHDDDDDSSHRNDPLQSRSRIDASSRSKSQSFVNADEDSEEEPEIRGEGGGWVVDRSTFGGDPTEPVMAPGSHGFVSHNGVVFSHGSLTNPSRLPTAGLALPYTPSDEPSVSSVSYDVVRGHAGIHPGIHPGIPTGPPPVLAGTSKGLKVRATPLLKPATGSSGGAAKSHVVPGAGGKLKLQGMSKVGSERAEAIGLNANLLGSNSILGTGTIGVGGSRPTSARSMGRASAIGSYSTRSQVEVGAAEEDRAGLPLETSTRPSARRLGVQLRP